MGKIPTYNSAAVKFGSAAPDTSGLRHKCSMDLEPVGTLEEVLVEKIAHEYWRLGVAAWHETEERSQANPFKRTSIDRIIRDQTTINRQFFQAMNQLKRLQRLRKGESVPAPLTLQVSHDADDPRSRKLRRLSALCRGSWPK